MVTDISGHFIKAWGFMLNKTICLVFLIGTTLILKGMIRIKLRSVDAMIAQDFHL